MPFKDAEKQRAYMREYMRKRHHREKEYKVDMDPNNMTNDELIEWAKTYIPKLNERRKKRHKATKRCEVCGIDIHETRFERHVNGVVHKKNMPKVE